jgi:hypothetical protein
MMRIRTQVQANVTAVKTAGELLGALIDTFV